MARTYRKYVKCGYCTGSNTEYYRGRNRKARNVNRHNLRNLMANYDIDVVNDKVMTVQYPHDSWNEPTDGTFLMTKNDRRNYVNGTDRSYTTKINYWNHKFGKYLKNKHNRNEK